MINTKELLQKIESGEVSYEDKLAALGQVETALREQRERKEAVLNDRVGVIIDALKTMQAKVAAQLEEAKAIVPEVGPAGPKGEAGDRGLDGSNGRDGRDGVDGRNGVDGVDGISVTDANIDFDGSLIITLSSGRVINVGEVVAPDLAEKIKVITNGGGTSQGVLDAIAAIEAIIATYGTMALQNANAVAITGGNINNTVIGNTTPNAATFTTLSTGALTATGQTSLGGAAGAESFRAVTNAGQNTYIEAKGGVYGSTSPQIVSRPPSAGSGFNIANGNQGAVSFYTNDVTSASLQLRIAHTTSAVNYVQVTGAATGNAVNLSAQGSDTNIQFNINSKNAFGIQFGTGGGTQFLVSNTAAAANYLRATGGSTGTGPILSAQGSDTNISQVFQSKGTGAIDLAAGSSGVNISNGGTVTAITRTNGGSTYTSFPTLAISAPTTAGGVQATATFTLGLGGTPTVTSGGTGYTVGDRLTAVGGTGTAAVLIVSTVSAGVITAVTVSNFGVYTVLPTVPYTVTGGTGSSATFTSTFGVNSVFTITNAGSGYVEQPTVTFSGGGGSGAAAYAIVGGGSVIKGIGVTGVATIDFDTPQSITASIPALRIRDGVSDSYPQINNTGNQAFIVAAGATNANFGISAAGNGNVRLMTSGTSQTEQLRVSHTASAVNYVQVTGAATTATPAITAQGSDTNISIYMSSKGTGAVRFFTNGAGSEQFRVLHTAGTIVNYAAATGSATGAAPTFTVAGTDTNIDLALTPKGTGLVRFGTRTASADAAITGYIEIKDSAGTTRRLAVIG